MEWKDFGRNLLEANPSAGPWGSCRSEEGPLSTHREHRQVPQQREKAVSGRNQATIGVCAPQKQDSYGKSLDHC